MFVLIHHSPQGYNNKKKTSFINTNYIIAIHTTDLSIHTVSGYYTNIDPNDIKKLVDIVTSIKMESESEVIK